MTIRTVAELRSVKFSTQQHSHRRSASSYHFLVVHKKGNQQYINYQIIHFYMLLWMPMKTWATEQLS